LTPITANNPRKTPKNTPSATAGTPSKTRQKSTEIHPRHSEGLFSLFILIKVYGNNTRIALVLLIFFRNFATCYETLIAYLITGVTVSGSIVIQWLRPCTATV
ncbi:MAG: hypothetical protein K2G94_01930, partial [Muribaculaceae bacterium]|nr:hypothetical protein [Muribaculaceae bacterium]